MVDESRGFIRDQAEIEAFLTRKWNRDLDYRLTKGVWALRDNRIAVSFAYEWHDDSDDWFRSYGNENWEFNEHGLMHLRIASINDLTIKESERKYHWPLGRRPYDHPSLSDLGLYTSLRNSGDRSPQGLQDAVFGGQIFVPRQEFLVHRPR